MVDLEHSDVSAAQRDGYPSWQAPGNADCKEMRDRYDAEYQDEFLDWIKEKHPYLVDEWREESGYHEWLNS